jgi:hypothetical protein
MTSRSFTLSVIGGILGFLITGSPAVSQLNSYIQAVRPLSATEGEPLVVTAALVHSSSITRVVLYYRQLGGSDFRSVEMELSRDSASAMIPEREVAPPFIELYVAAETQFGLRETYPISLPQSAPARIMILPRPAKETEVLLLSPDVNEAILPEDLYISLSFVYAGDAVDKRKTKIYLNNRDLSSRALTTGDLMIIPSEMIPGELKQGECSLSVQVFDSAGAPYAALRRSFTLLRTRDAGHAPIPFVLSGSAQVESRSENIKGAAKVYNRFDVRAFSSYGILKTTANLQLTSEERPENQPQNRYFVGFDARYVTLGLGDTYPQFPSTLMDGRRVRGVSATAGYGAVQIAATSGEIVRSVALNDITQSHRRTLTAIRPSFGKGENFQWGFTYLHSKDEWEAGTTLKPRENVVAGTDLYAAIDNRRIEWTTQAAVSITNKDISSPEFTADSIDAAVARGSLKTGDGDLLKNLLPYASKVITFNENLTPLNPGGFSSLACETSLSFNYFNNYLKGTYTFHGNDYMSFGTSSFRNDIQGYNVTDRLRLLGNSVFVTASLEQLRNNVSRYEAAATKWTTMTASVSYFGAGRMPDMTLGCSVNNIVNGASMHDTLGNTAAGSSPMLDFATNRFFVQSSYVFKWIGQHSALLSLDYTGANDKTVRNQDVAGFNGMMMLTTVHSASLESTLGVTTSVNSLPGVSRADSTAGTSASAAAASTSLNYSSLTLGVGYKFFKERMKASALVSPTFGDYRRTQLEAQFQYAVLPRHLFTAQYHYIVNSSLQPTPLMSTVNDSAFTIAYRMDL